MRNLAGLMSIICVLSLGAATKGATVAMDGVVASYWFESDLTNNANPGTFDAARHGGGAWNSSANPSGPGFTGKSDFDGGDGLSNRGALVVGNALNLVDARNDAITVPLGTAELGQNFAISVWHALTPGASNGSARYFVLESSNNVNIGWGMLANVTANPTPPQYHASYTYQAWIGNVGAGATQVGLDTNQWYHTVLSVSSDGTTTTVSTYVNGSLIGSGTAPTANMNFAALNFGRQRSVDAGDRELDGMLDEIVIFDRALGAGDVAALYQAGLNGDHIMPIPEPASLGFAALGLLGIAAARLRRR